MGSELDEAVTALARGARLIEARLDSMTLPQMRVLRLVSRAPERASALAERAEVTRPALTGVLDGLEARGWLERSEVTGDRRGVQLEVTAAGGKALRAETRRIAERLDEVLATIEPAQRKAVIDGLAGLSQAMDRWHETRKHKS